MLLRVRGELRAGNPVRGVEIEEGLMEADAVICLIGDSDRRADLTARGRVRSAQWAPRTMAAEVLAAYRDLGKVDVPMTEAV